MSIWVLNIWCHHFHFLFYCFFTLLRTLLSFSWTTLIIFLLPFTSLFFPASSDFSLLCTISSDVFKNYSSDSLSSQQHGLQDKVSIVFLWSNPSPSLVSDSASPAPHSLPHTVQYALQFLIVCICRIFHTIPQPSASLCPQVFYFQPTHNLLYKILFSLPRGGIGTSSCSTFIIPYVNSTNSLHVSGELAYSSASCTGLYPPWGPRLWLIYLWQPCKGSIIVWIKKWHINHIFQRNKHELHTSLFWRFSEVEGKDSTVFPGHTAIWLTASLFLKGNALTYHIITLHIISTFYFKIQKDYYRKFCNHKGLELQH